MGALLGAVLGAGLLLIWRSGDRAPERHPGRLGVARRRVELLHQAGLGGVRPIHLVGAQFGCAALAAVVVLLASRTVTVACCFAVFAFAAPVVLVRRIHRRRQLALRELWPEAIDNLASAVRAGMSLPEGISALSFRGPEPLRAPFARFGASYRASGRFDACLDGLKDELADPVGDRICETIRVAREVGGSDLGTVLRTLSELLRSDARVRAELETRQGWVVNAARLGVASPWAVLLLLSTQPTTVQAYDSAGGALLLAVGAAASVLAYRVMLRLGALPEPRRVLR